MPLFFTGRRLSPPCIGIDVPGQLEDCKYSIGRRSSALKAGINVELLAEDLQEDFVVVFIVVLNGTQGLRNIKSTDQSISGDGGAFGLSTIRV